MHQTYKVLSFAIVAALYIFLVPSTSHATRDYAGDGTHTPGETVGPASRPPIPCGNNCTQQGCEDKLIREEYGNEELYAMSELCMPYEHRHTDQPRWMWPENCRGDQLYVARRNVGLGYEIRYIQATGGYCYYYQGGTSSGRSGPNTWRYDPDASLGPPDEPNRYRSRTVCGPLGCLTAPD